MNDLKHDDECGIDDLEGYSDEDDECDVHEDNYNCYYND